MTRFKTLFDKLRREGKKALGVYLTVGDPDVETTHACARAAIEAGADFLELGVPFSDPSADGPVIQRAMERALEQGVGLGHALDVARDLRADFADTPIVLFGYANPFFKAREGLRARLAQAAVDGVLIVDVPPEHDADFAPLLQGVDCIRLLGVNATPERREIVARAARGFIYAIAFTGITGAEAEAGAREGLQAQLAAVRALTPLPICIGFGVRREADARALAPLADGVIAGSVFVEAIEKAGRSKDAARAAVAEKVAELRRGLDAAR